MDSSTDPHIRRASSTHSASSGSRKSAAGLAARRSKPRKTASHASLAKAQAPTPSDKSLTSFPSLSPSPEASPIATRFCEPELSQPQSPQLPQENTGLPDPPTVRKAPKPLQSIVGSLLAAVPSSDDRSALFDDTPQDVRSVPGNLHHASEEQIERMLARSGPVSLVKQLAQDLAQRDAQITALRRKAEERERILRKMLQECEVSNLDIDERLKLLERGPTPNGASDAGERGRRAKRQSLVDLDGLHPEDPIDKHLARAMSDENDGERELMVEDDASLTAFPSLSDDHSVNSADLATNKSTKGWKSFWTGSMANKRRSQTPSVASAYDEDIQSRSRASSGAQRKPLSNDLFAPPSKAVDQLKKLESGDEASISSRKSSGSVASWALRLVAGNNQTNRENDKAGSLRGRPSVNGLDTDRSQRTTSMDSSKTTGTASKAQGRGARTSLGPTGTIKKNLAPESLRNAATTAQGSSPPAVRSVSNLGPVEMDMILPEDSRPPTLMPQNNFGDDSEFLTDRFGFIYDQRRKKRQAQAAAAALEKNKQHRKSESLGTARTMLRSRNGEGEVSTGQGEEEGPIPRPESVLSQHEDSLPAKRSWQDYLKIATFPTELLSHTPVAAHMTKVDVIVQNNASFPAVSSNPEPSLSIESGAAEIAQPTLSGPASPVTADLSSPQPDPVKALLDQLTDLHDSLQRDKQTKWHEFLRKVRAERKREGDAVAASEGRGKNTMPETLLTDGEIIGIAGLGNKGKIGRAKWKEFKNLVLGGIPVSYRAKIWAECSGAAAMRIPGYYEDLVANGTDDPAVVSQIQMDIHRTLTDNIFFRRGPGVQKLNEVLVAYARRNTAVGYCQGMNLITACLLLIMPTAEDAFWMLATMIESILPESYYDHSLLASRADQIVLRQYVAELLPKLSAHFDDLSIELEALTFQWFLSVFTDCLSAEALFRVWDVVLCMHDGSTFLFQVALALLKLNEKALIECDNPGAVYHYINQQMTNHAISIDGLIQASEALKKVVRRRDVEDRRAKAIEHEKEVMRQREELRNERLNKLKGKGDVEGDSDGSAPPPPQLLIESATGEFPDITSISPPEPNTPTTMTSSVSFSSSRDEEENLHDELERSLTPMPIDEEAMWRA
ncbi:rab-GTPase-TBC domain-containing protein [Macrophomina phaseolina]|uniref:Rab-GTPase-TBC domain-containing protein n=1 Tax=Macrophomina phaseolina TaxID=35725 RepID=A0ABQ8GGK2_9PEZI|nr:rab-GTPase-TBC domain-containing protein [Macrophomina phaseolina]